MKAYTFFHIFQQIREITARNSMNVFFDFPHINSFFQIGLKFSDTICNKQISKIDTRNGLKIRNWLFCRNGTKRIRNSIQLVKKLQQKFLILLNSKNRK